MEERATRLHSMTSRASLDGRGLEGIGPREITIVDAFKVNWAIEAFSEGVGATRTPRDPQTVAPSNWIRFSTVELHSGSTN